jgi:Rrf2 family transcriptional regulator, iron-sulfur cluster assembly transcription factor
MKLDLKPRTELTLQALVVLADGQRWRAGDLADWVGTSGAYIAHLVAPLTRRGWVASTPGPTGGHQLVVALDSVSLLDLVEAVEGPTDDGSCVMKRQPCPGPQQCVLHDAWTRAREAMTTELAATPLSSVIHQKAASR